jgi:hypothetical protein
MLQDVLLSGMGQRVRLSMRAGEEQPGNLVNVPCSREDLEIPEALPIVLLFLPERKASMKPEARATDDILTFWRVLSIIANSPFMLTI